MAGLSIKGAKFTQSILIDAVLCGVPSAPPQSVRIHSGYVRLAEQFTITFSVSIVNRMFSPSPAEIEKSWDSDLQRLLLQNPQGVKFHRRLYRQGYDYEELNVK